MGGGGGKLASSAEYSTPKRKAHSTIIFGTGRESGVSEFHEYYSIHAHAKLDLGIGSNEAAKIITTTLL